jgi:hypothetical protein
MRGVQDALPEPRPIAIDELGERLDAVRLCEPAALAGARDVIALGFASYPFVQLSA